MVDKEIIAATVIFAVVVYSWLRSRVIKERRQALYNQISLGDRDFKARVIRVRKGKRQQKIWCRVKLNEVYVRFYFVTGAQAGFKSGEKYLFSASSFDPETAEMHLTSVRPRKQK